MDDLSRKMFEAGIRQWTLNYLLKETDSGNKNINDIGLGLLEDARPICQKVFDDMINLAKEKGILNK